MADRVCAIEGVVGSDALDEIQSLKISLLML